MIEKKNLKSSGCNFCVDICYYEGTKSRTKFKQLKHLNIEMLYLRIYAFKCLSYLFWLRQATGVLVTT